MLGGRIAGTRGAALGAVYGVSQPGPVKIAAATALGALAFGPVGAAVAAYAVATPRHRQKATIASLAGAFINPVAAGVSAAFLGR